MSDFEKTVEYVRGRTLTITSWLDAESGTWKASAPGFILRFGRADAPGQSSRQAAVSAVVREMDTLLSTSRPESGSARRPRY